MKWGWGRPARTKDGLAKDGLAKDGLAQDGLAADRDRPVESAKERAAHARQAAMVAPPPFVPPLHPSVLVETTFTENDPRACPREEEEFRLSVALELDRLRANKKNYEI